MIRLEPMDQARYDTWLYATVREYAAEKVASGNYPEEGAFERLQAEFVKLLPNGRETAGQEIRSMVDDAGGPEGAAGASTETSSGFAQEVTGAACW